MCYNSLSVLEWSLVAVGSCVVVVAEGSCIVVVTVGSCVVAVAVGSLQLTLTSCIHVQTHNGSN